MGVYIKCMEMPECCGYCPFEYKNYCMVKPSLMVESADRHPRCPLIEIPPHGRLIDADELLMHRFVGVVGEAEKSSYMVGWNSAIEAVVENAHTVIPAEEEKEP